jgi:GNAT superfamily N-acetyltransferase
MVAAVAGYSWAASAELKQMWIEKSHRGRGYARALLNAFVAEARRRNVRKIWLASYDFQTPDGPHSAFGRGFYLRSIEIRPHRQDQDEGDEPDHRRKCFILSAIDESGN